MFCLNCKGGNGASSPDPMRSSSGGASGIPQSQHHATQTGYDTFGRPMFTTPGTGFNTIPGKCLMFFP